FGGEGLLIRYVNFVKLPHTVFALPFALLGLLVASREAAVTWRTLGLVVLAFTCARFVALGFNRIADRELDAKNPRTRARELPSGRLTLRQAWSAVALAAALFLWTAWALNSGWAGSTSSTRSRTRRSIARSGSRRWSCGSARRAPSWSASCCTVSRSGRWCCSASAPASESGTTAASWSVPR